MWQGSIYWMISATIYNYSSYLPFDDKEIANMNLQSLLRVFLEVFTFTNNFSSTCQIVLLSWRSNSTFSTFYSRTRSIRTRLRTYSAEDILSDNTYRSLMADFSPICSIINNLVSLCHLCHKWHM